MGSAYCDLIRRPTWSNYLKSGLIHMWEFNGDALDDVGNADLTISGMVAFEQGKIKQSALFSGGYMFNQTSSLLNNDWTVSVWVKMNKESSSEISGLLNNSITVGGVNNAYGLRIANRKFNYINGHIGTNIYGNKVMNLNEWYHICAVREYNKLYINGVADTLTNVIGILNVPAPIYIGVDNYAFNLRQLFGYLEQFAIWGRSLSESEVLEIYNNGKGLRYK